MKLAKPARWLSIFVLGGWLFLPLTGAAAQAGATGQTQTTTAPATKRKGVWHHFGDHDTSRTRPPATGGWHYFGHAGKATAPKPTPAPRQARPAPRAVKPRPRQTDHTVTTRNLEWRMFELINRDRRDSGGGRLRPLHWDAKLAAVARAHSLDMLRRGYFGHVAPDGQTVIDRLNAAKIPWTAEGENIALNWSVSGAERAFMNEPRFQKNHRWNILNSHYTEVGVGIVRGPGGEYYITQDFIESQTAR